MKFFIRFLKTLLAIAALIAVAFMSLEMMAPIFQGNVPEQLRVLLLLVSLMLMILLKNFFLEESIMPHRRALVIGGVRFLMASIVLMIVEIWLFKQAAVSAFFDLHPNLGLVINVVLVFLLLEVTMRKYLRGVWSSYREKQ